MSEDRKDRLVMANPTLVPLHTVLEIAAEALRELQVEIDAAVQELNTLNQRRAAVDERIERLTNERVRLQKMHRGLADLGEKDGPTPVLDRREKPRKDLSPW